MPAAMTSRLFRIGLLAVVCWAAHAVAWAQLPDVCTPRVLRKITAAITSGTLDRALVDDWARRYLAADDVVKQGMAKAVLRKDVKAMIEGFRDLKPGANPFSTEEEVYRAIGKLVGPDVGGEVPNVNYIVGNIFANVDTNETGGLLVLKVADELNLSDAIRNGDNLFEQRVLLQFGDPVETVVRVSDITHGGTFHEIKNWVAPLTSVNDARLVEFAGQFQKDIILQAGSNWSSYHITMRLPPDADRGLVLSRLLQEFESDLVKKRYPLPEERQIVRQAFEAQWHASEVVTFR